MMRRVTHELGRSRLIPAALVASLASLVLVAGCGNSTVSADHDSTSTASTARPLPFIIPPANSRPLTPEEELEKKEKERQQAIDSSPAIVAKYYPNGTRRLSYERSVLDLSSVFQGCVGGDLVSQTDYNTNSGNSIDVSPGYPACADGRLTAEEFVNPDTSKVTP